MTNTTKHIVIITTAAPPWLTGTAVNPALRAAFLAKAGHHVTLMLPFLPPEQQPNIFQPGQVFTTPEQQKRHVIEFLHARGCHWVTGRGGCVDVVFYEGRYDTMFCSILPVGDLTLLVDKGGKPDLILLEEPEHLTWYHHGPRWMSRFPNVTGIAHTNYVDYVAREAGEAAAQGIARLNKFLVGVHCHRVIKLSDAVQPLPRQITMFVHGVSEGFLAVGERVRQGKLKQTPTMYFLGKALWSKGYRELLDALNVYYGGHSSNKATTTDIYGSGEHLQEIQQAATPLSDNITFHGARDHLLCQDIHKHQIFINPSTSDVVATTSAEALAMNKWVICARHPCNAWFGQHFRNALLYDDYQGFCACVERALREPPAPLDAQEQRLLSWEDACERLMDVSFSNAPEPDEIDVHHASPGLLQSLTYTAYSSLLGIELIRRAVGAGPKRGEEEAARTEQLEQLAQLETYPQGCF